MAADRQLSHHYDASGMKLVMTLLVRNEVDVIEANLEYHLAQGVDFVIVTDHDSDDGTSEILREYERMGVAKVIRDDEEGHHQSNRVTRMAEIARLGHGADWVIHNDADEFWWPLVGDLRDVFSSVPPQFGQIKVKRRNFRPMPDEEGSFYSRLVHRESNSLNLSGLALEFKVAHRPWPGVVIAPGNHSIRGVDLPSVPISEVLEIFHFPMRSYEQFEHKVVQIGHGYEQIPNLSPEVGGDQLALLARHRGGTLREYYDGLVLDGDALQRGLQIGSIVVDRRLETFMRDMHSGERSQARADAPYASILLQRMMSTVGELEKRHEELAALRSELEHEREHAQNERARAVVERERVENEQALSEQLHRQIAEMRVRQEHSADELRHTSEALHLLRSSRLMRSTAMARRLYYRATGKA
jgi:hypothetical protein